MPDKNNPHPDDSSPLDRYETVAQKDFQALKIRYLELTSLFEINKILNSTLELKTILDNVLLTPMGRLMIGKGMVLLLEQPNILKVENLKGVTSRLLGQRYTLERFPEHSLLISEVEAESDRFVRAMQGNRMEILVPMLAGSKYLGLMAYGKKFSNEPFTPEDIDFLESLANLAAIAVDKSLLFKQIQATNKALDKKIQQLNTLFEISRELNSSLEQSQITQMLSFAIMGELLINRCVVLIRSNGEFQIDAAKGLGEKSKNLDWTPCLSLSYFSFQQHPYLNLEDEIDDPHLSELCNRLQELGLKYMIPMFSKNEIKGFIGIGKKITGEDVHPDELSFLQTLGNEAMISIENARMVREMLEKQRMEEELKIAREIQTNLLPSRLPQIPGFEIAGSNISSYQVGGDYYDCIRLNEHLYGIAIADVSGKSTPAALLMSNLQASLRALASEHHHVVETVEHINKIICENTTIDKFITFFYCILNVKNHTLTYTNAGHNPPYLIRKDGSLMHLKKGGLILGLLPDAPYESETIQLQNGDLLFLFTDGVTEAMNAKEEEFEETRLVDILKEIHTLSAAEVLDRVRQAVTDFVAGVAQSDDITMVALRVVE